MALKKKILDLTWSQLTDKQKKNFSSKSDFTSQKKASTSPENISSKKAATLAIQQDKGKLKPKDVAKIAEDTGLTTKQVTRQAAELAIEQDKGKLKPKDVAKIAKDLKINPKQVTNIATKQNKDLSELAGGKKFFTDAPVQGPVKKTPTQTQTTTGGKSGGDKGDVNGGGDKGGDKKDTTIKDLKSDLKEAESKIEDFPGADGGKLKGKDFKGYKTQSKKIREAAEADLALRLAKKTEPKTLEKAENLKSKFEGGRAKREKQLAKISDAKRPEFKDYKQAVKDIRKGGGAAKEYAYSGKFENLGAKLGVKYGEQKREKRTERRFASLREGLKNEKLGKAYSTASDTAKTQRKKGRKAMKLFRGESVA